MGQRIEGAASASRPDGRALPHLLLIGAVLFATTLAGPAVHLRLGDVAFIVLAVAQGLLVLLATRRAVLCPVRPALAAILAVALALRLALLFVPPHLSSDPYRYVWDGRVQGAGINPYRYMPSAPELSGLRDEAIYPLINRKDTAVTIYPPAAQMLFLLANRLHDGLLSVKLALIACEAVTVAVLLSLLRRLGRPPTRVLAYAWHPLAVWEIAGSAHIDAAMVAGMMLGLWIALALRRPVLAAAVLAVAALFKPLAVLALPAAWRPWDWRAPAVAVAVAAALYVPYVSVGAGVIGYLPGYVGEENIANGEAFWLVMVAERLFGPLAWAKLAYMAGAALLLAALALAVPFGRDGSMEARLTRVFWLALTFTMLLSPKYPWYYLVLTPFVALLGPAPGWAATIGCFLLYDERWDDWPPVNRDVMRTLFNLTVLSALAFAARRRLLAPPARALEDPAQ